MGLRDFLRLPKIRGRKRSKARSEIENPSTVGPAVPRPSESTPDLRIGASSSPLTSHDQEFNGMPAVSSHTINLTTPHADRPSNSDRHHQSTSNRTEGTHPGSSKPAVGPGTTGGNKSNLKSLVYSGARFILNGVKESADAFGPLKSVASGLCFVLDNCEVRRSPASAVQNAHPHTQQQMKANKQSIESLAPRIQALAESLCAPISEDDIKERSRRNVLER